jgi:hypothetical protein
MKRIFLLLVIFVTLSIDLVWAQDHTQQLRSPATAHGFVGGEAHDSYVIHLRKGEMLTVQISWRHEHTDQGDNHAEFFVSELPDFGDDGKKFGKEFDNGKSWTGQVSKTGNYYIYVMAHPTAHYTLRVRTK